MTNLPQTGNPKETPALKVAPYGGDVFIDFERGKQFVTLLYRHKKPGPRDRQWALVTAALDGLTAAGVSVAGPLEIRLTPQSAALGQIQTADTPYVISIRVPVTPTEEQRAQLAPMGVIVKRALGKEG